MREDPVRALRAARFAARLGFTIEPDTFEAMRRHAGELARCAPARVLEETFKILRCGGSARALELLRACGALPVILPALGAALESWDEARRRAFSAHLAALDRLVRSGAEISDAVLLGALLMHLGDPQARPGGPERSPPSSGGDGAAAGAALPREADAILASLLVTSRLPRKVAERTRLALHAQRLFREPPKRRRRGRGLAGQPYFEDALQLLQVSVEATGREREILERWRAAARGEPRGEDARELAEETAGDEALPSEEVALAEVEAEVSRRNGAARAPAEPGAQGASEGTRRRRRRGGRRRRRRGAGAAAPV
jgi:poly(A) polymerase